jgi:hypothetical protein
MNQQENITKLNYGTYQVIVHVVVEYTNCSVLFKNKLILEQSGFMSLQVVRKKT